MQVCLSLLGTFPGGDESAKWSPQYSSLFQLLMSVQTQLLTPDPYFNEPVCTVCAGKLLWGNMVDAMSFLEVMASQCYSA